MAKKKQQTSQLQTPKTSPSGANAKSAHLPTNLPQNSFFDNQKIAFILLIAAVFLAFAGGFSNNFLIWDDQVYVDENKYIQTPIFANLLRLLGVECALNYHPLTMASLWLNAFLFGKGATSFIVTNTLFHIVNTLLVFIFVKKLTKNNHFVAFFTALLWGVHPMHTESVTWISERKDVLYACFFLLACIQYTKFITTENKRFLVYTFLFFILSCLSKGMAVVLPLVLFLIDYWQGKNLFSWKNIVSKIPFFILALLFGALAIHIQGGGNLGGRLEKMSESSALGDLFTVGQKICFGFYAFLVYIFKLFIPIHQHNFYAYPFIQNYNDLQYLTAPLGGLLILGIGIWSYRRKKEVFFGVLFFFFTIFTVLQFLSVGAAILAERYTYLPYFGLIFMLVYWLNKQFKQQILSIILSVISIIFIFLTYQQTKTYKDTVTLFENSYKYESESAVVAEKLAFYYGKNGAFQKTIQYGEIALSKGVSSFGLLGSLGNAYYLVGDLKKSKEYFDKAVPITPSYKKSEVYHNRGIMNNAAGNYAEAASDFDNAMKFDTTTIKQYLKQKAYSELLAKNNQQAQIDYTKMINLGIALDTAYNNRAVVRFQLGDRKGTIEDLQMVLKINPNYIEAKNNLAKLGLTK